MDVPFNDLQQVFNIRPDEYDQAILNTLHSGNYVLGEQVQEFERAFASYIGMEFGVGVNSGQDALTFAIRALGIGPGDEVIVQANAYIASVLAITENGATPVFIESDEFFGIDGSKIEEAITPKTKAILPVHIYGQPCDMAIICKTAADHGLFVVEDCAQCHGSAYFDKKAGSFGDISCFSFYPTKPLGAFGDGGICLTNDERLFEKLQMLRYYGSRKKYVNEIEGVNSRLDELQASALLVRLKYLDSDNQARQYIASRYLREINNPLIELPKMRPNCSHVFHVFPVLCEYRDDLESYLEQEGIGVGIHYPIPPHLQECYTYLGYNSGDFPVTEKFAECELSLPIYAGMTDSQIKKVIDAINNFTMEIY